VSKRVRYFAVVEYDVIPAQYPGGDTNPELVGNEVIYNTDKDYVLDNLGVGLDPGDEIQEITFQVIEDGMVTFERKVEPELRQEEPA